MPERTEARPSVATTPGPDGTAQRATHRWGAGLVLVAVVMVPVAAWSVAGVGPTALLMLATGWLAISYRIATATLLHTPRPVVALGVLALSFVASTAFAQAPASAVRISLTMVVGVGFTLAVVTFMQRDLLRYVTACLAMAGIVAVWSLTQVGQTTAHVGGGVVEGRLQGPFSQPNELGAYCTLVLPLCVAAAACAGGRRTRLGAGAVAVLVAAAGTLSMSRGAWMGAVAGLVMLWAFVPVVRRPLRRVGAVAAGLLVLSVPLTSGSTLSVLVARIESFGTAGDNPQDFRPELWATGVRVALEHPLLGVGPGQFKTASSDGTHMLYAYPADHPHNLYLTVAAEEGLLGLAAFGLAVAALIAGLVTVLRTSAPVDDPAPARWCAAAASAGLLGLGVHGIVDAPLLNPIVNATVWVVIALAVTAAAAAADAPAAERPRSPS